MKDKITVHVCGTDKQRRKIWCSTAGCEQLATSACVFKLGGRLVGQTCGRALCASCALSSSTCAPHLRLSAKRAAI